MAVTGPDPVIQEVLDEQNQGHDTRKPLIEELENKLGRPVVTFFTSFSAPVSISDDDADMIEGILQTLDLTNGLALMISSPGGDGLAAERIINICRAYSGTDEYWAVVPGKAKSAATMICFGSSKIYMGPASELGPVDPQLIRSDGGMVRRLSVYNVIESYDNLFRRAVRVTTGNLEPYLQQLKRYDEREVKELRAALALSQDIAVRALADGMMRGTSKKRIRKKIKMFLTPERTKTHGRPIYQDEADDCGLNVESREPQEDLWKLVYQIYIRTNNFVNSRAPKCVESRTHSYIAGGAND